MNKKDDSVPLDVAEKLLQIDASYKDGLRWLVDHDYIDYAQTPDPGQASVVLWWLIHWSEGKLPEFHFQFVYEGGWWMFRILRGGTQMFKGRVPTVMGAYKEAYDTIIDRLARNPSKTLRYEHMQDTLNVLEQLMKEDGQEGK